MRWRWRLVRLALEGGVNPAVLRSEVTDHKRSNKASTRSALDSRPTANFASQPPPARSTNLLVRFGL